MKDPFNSFTPHLNLANMVHLNPGALIFSLLSTVITVNSLAIPSFYSDTIKNHITSTRGTLDDDLMLSNLIASHDNNTSTSHISKIESNSVLTSAFPVDLIISYNDTAGLPKQFLARYASFSPILNVKLKSRFHILNSTACSPLNLSDFPDVKGKILIVQRGVCAFVDKVTNLLESHLDPRAIIIANNEPHRGLVTMYSTNFNEDGLVTIPILFMTLEDFNGLKSLQDTDTLLSIQTASIDGLVGVMLLMAVSPTLLILLCYLIIKCLKHFRQKTLNTRYKKIVQRLPVYIFNANHLIPAVNFYSYLGKTHQVEDIPLIPSSCDDLSLQENEQSRINTSYIINGTDVHSMTDLDLLFADKDYYRSLKCSICLGNFVALKSRVLVLKCKHVYHESCLSNWLVNFRRTCPLCNENLNLLEQSASRHPIRAYNSFALADALTSPRNGELSGAEPILAQHNITVSNETSNEISNSRLQLLPAVEDHSLYTSSSTAHNTETSSTTNEQGKQICENLEGSTNQQLLGNTLSESIQSSASFVTTKSLLSEVISNPFFTPQSTRFESVEEDGELFELSVSTIRLP